MAKIEIRSARSGDINRIIEFDHSIESNLVFQIDQRRDESFMQVQFNQIHLPRNLKLEYPYDNGHIKNKWQFYDSFLIAFHNNQPVGYITGLISNNRATLNIDNIVVDFSERRQGIASALIMAIIDWGSTHQISNYVISVSPKNHAGINLLRKMGFVFCGYNEFHYPGMQMAFYFGFSR